VNVATNTVTLVPDGTVTEIVFAFSFITPVAAKLVNEKAVMAFAEEGGAELSLPPLPPPHPAIIAIIIATERMENIFLFNIAVPSLYQSLMHYRMKNSDVGLTQL
jgi:hypothetical protein